MRADWDFSEDGAYDALQLFLSDGRYQSRDLMTKSLQICRNRVALLFIGWCFFYEDDVRVMLQGGYEKKDQGIASKKDDLPYFDVTGNRAKAHVYSDVFDLCYNWSKPYPIILIIGIRRYEKESSRGDQLNTSRISPYMHFGQISPRQVLWEAKPAKSQKYLRKLAWRDLSYWLLHLWPDMPSQPIRPHYAVSRFNSLWLSDAIWRHRPGSDSGLLLDGTKPLPETMLTYHQQGLVASN